MAKRKGSNTGIPGLSFSWKKAMGITKLKRDFAKATGIPTTRAGRERKIGGFLIGKGCMTPMLLIGMLMCIILLI